MFIIKVQLAQDNVYGALNTDQQSYPNQIVYHNEFKSDNLQIRLI